MSYQTQGVETLPHTIGIDVQDRSSKVWKHRVVGALVAALAISGLAVSLSKYRGEIWTRDTSALAQGQGQHLDVTVQNAYTLRDGKPYLKYYPWLAQTEVLEPYRESTLSVMNPVDEATYTWIFSPEQTQLSGSTISYTCTSTGVLGVEVKETVNGVSGRAFKGNWYCKYVRRELRALFDDDRESFFDAMQVLYEVGDDLGRKLFGQNYRSMDGLVTQHNTMAGKKDCDHAHDGRGFLVSHTVLTNIFEKSLQAVNPSVTVAYWDFTIDYHKVKVGEIDSWFDSEVFQDDWLGEADPDGYAITKGRWAYLPVNTHAQDAEVHNAYGILRAAWNVNPYPYLTRCGSMMGIEQPLGQAPSCSSHYSLLKQSTWMDFGLSSQYSPHGGVHTMLGGMWGGNYYELMAEFDYPTDSIKAVAQSTYILQKYMWRAGYLKCPTVCDVKMSIEECKCTCPELDSMSSDDLDSIFSSYPPLASDKYKVSSTGEDVRYEVVKLLCQNDEGIYSMMGDQLESASPADPSFWPIHPALERIWQWKRIVGFTSEAWTSSANECYGHGPDDIEPFQNAMPMQDRLLTNSELYDFLSPMKDTIPYIYDSFEWPHCEEEGYPLNLTD